MARAAGALGEEPRLQPVLVGAIFAWRGRGSWALTSERAAGAAEVERRARRYGLPPLVWPENWPLNSLSAMRAALWADRQGAAAPFARAVYEREFAHGEDITDVALLDGIGRSVGVEGISEAVADPAIKRALREATEAAWERGVQGVPTLEDGRRLYFGDDRLEEAAAAKRREVRTRPT